MNKFSALEKSMCRELETIERKLESGQEMSIQDLDKADKLAHAMKSLAAYVAMKKAEEYDEGGFSSENGSDNGGNSGYRGRGADGRFVSRKSGNNEYSEGYYNGYSEAMSQMNGNNSGHNPMGPGYYPTNRW